jgi:hypothetical protein
MFSRKKWNVYTSPQCVEELHKRLPLSIKNDKTVVVSESLLVLKKTEEKGVSNKTKIC